mgnify:CR=1 FL=1
MGVYCSAHKYIYSLQIFSTTQDRLLALSALSPPGMAAPLHAVRAQHVLPSAHAPRASPRAHPALILPKHSPVRPRLNCFLTFNCSRVPCSELTSSRSTREALRAHPATIAVEVRGALTELEHAPARPGSMTLGRLYLKVVICAWMRTRSAPELGPARSLKLCPS